MVNGKLVNGFEFSTAGRILFGAGKFAELPAAAATLGQKVFLVTGKDPAREMIRLTTYLGHSSPSATYWYMEAVPELLDLAMARATISGGEAVQ